MSILSKQHSSRAAETDTSLLLYFICQEFYWRPSAYMWLVRWHPCSDGVDRMHAMPVCLHFQCAAAAVLEIDA